MPNNFSITRLARPLSLLTPKEEGLLVPSKTAAQKPEPVPRPQFAELNIKRQPSDFKPAPAVLADNSASAKTDNDNMPAAVNEVNMRSTWIGTLNATDRYADSLLKELVTQFDEYSSFLDTSRINCTSTSTTNLPEDMHKKLCAQLALAEKFLKLAQSEMQSLVKASLKEHHNLYGLKELPLELSNTAKFMSADIWAKFNSIGQKNALALGSNEREARARILGRCETQARSFMEGQMPFLKLSKNSTEPQARKYLVACGKFASLQTIVNAAKKLTLLK